MNLTLGIQEIHDIQMGAMYITYYIIHIDGIYFKQFFSQINYSSTCCCYIF